MLNVELEIVLLRRGFNQCKTRCGGTTGRVAFPGVKNATPFAGANRGRFEGCAGARAGVSVPGRGTPLSFYKVDASELIIKDEFLHKAIT